MKILFADDHPLLLDGLITAIDRKFPNSELFTALNKTELFNQLRSQQVDILFQDLKFGTNHAKDFIHEIKKEFEELKIIILTSISDAATIHQFNKVADGYIIKSESLEVIYAAVETVLKHEKFLSPEAQQKLEANKSGYKIELTKREREVLKLILTSQTIKEIASNLNIAEKTVEMHRGNLFIKLDVKNVAGLVQKALSTNVLDD